MNTFDLIVHVALILLLLFCPTTLSTNTTTTASDNENTGSNDDELLTNANVTMIIVCGTLVVICVLIGIIMCYTAHEKYKRPYSDPQLEWALHTAPVARGMKTIQIRN